MAWEESARDRGQTPQQVFLATMLSCAHLLPCMLSWSPDPPYSESEAWLLHLPSFVLFPGIRSGTTLAVSLKPLMETRASPPAGLRALWRHAIAHSAQVIPRSRWTAFPGRSKPPGRAPSPEWRPHTAHLSAWAVPALHLCLLLPQSLCPTRVQRPPPPRSLSSCPLPVTFLLS